MPEKFSVQAVFTAVDHFSGPVGRMSDTLNKFNGKGGVGGKGPKMGSAFSEAGAAMGRMGERARIARNNIATIGVAGGYAAHRLIAHGADIESALLTGSAKFGDGIRRHTPEFAKLEEAAIDLGRKTKFGAIEAASALEGLAASGFEPSGAIKNLPIIAQMAIAGGEELGVASQMALESMGIFGMVTDEMGKLRAPEQLATNLTRVADVMSYVANQTTASVGSIHETLSESGAITKVGGMTFEKFGAITGALAQAGITGSQAGTAIKNISVRLLSPTPEGTKELRKLKIDEKSFRKMTDPLEQLELISKGISELPKEDKIKFLDEYFGKIPLAAASHLSTTGFRNARELESKIIANAPGSNARAVDIIADGTDTKMARLKNKFEEVGNVVFKQIQTPLEDTIEKAIKYLGDHQGEIAKSAEGAVNFVGNNGEEIGTALKWGAYGFAGAQGLKMASSTVKFGKDLWGLGVGAAAIAAKLGKAAVATNGFINTVSMGRLGFTLAGGAAAGAAAAGVGSAVIANSYLKDTTEGLGIFDIVGRSLNNAMYGGGPTGWFDIVDEHRNNLARQRHGVEVEQDEHAGRILTGSPMDSMFMTDHMAKVQEFLSKPEAVKPVEISKEAIAARIMPFTVQPVVDAITIAITAGVQSAVTNSRNGDIVEAIESNSNATANASADIRVTADPGTKAQVKRDNSTKINNHRTGTN
jgi:TP901 family phage tail tape measure protein